MGLQIHGEQLTDPFVSFVPVAGMTALCERGARCAATALRLTLPTPADSESPEVSPNQSEAERNIAVRDERRCAGEGVERRESREPQHSAAFFLIHSLCTKLDGCARPQMHPPQTGLQGRGPCPRFFLKNVPEK